MPRITFAVSSDGVTVAVLDGFVNDGPASDLHAALGWSLDGEGRTEHLCLEDFDAMGAAAAERVVAALRGLRASDGAIALGAPTDDVLRQLERVGLRSRFEVPAAAGNNGECPAEVEVFSSFDRTWVGGFQLHHEGHDGASGAATRTVRRTSDGSVLPHDFPAADVRSITPQQRDGRP